MNQTPKHQRLSFDQWAEQYEPERNTIDPTAGFDGLLFETYGDELRHVLAIANSEDRGRVWTWVDCEESDDGVIIEGYHLVDRIGYFITTKPAADGVQYTIAID